MRLLFATRNPGKLSEIRVMLAGTDWQVVPLASVAPDLTVEEDGRTFEANAHKKAKLAAEKSGMWTMADDSGLEVDALDGEPGVHSARYCGPNATDADRNRKVLERMVAVPDDKRTARFRCVICLVSLDGHSMTFDGACEGRISYHVRGSAGFGYDPIFIPDGQGKTFAELGLDVKNGLSHRARAIRKVVEHLRKL